MNCGKDPGNAKRVRHRVLVSKKGVAAARRRLEPGECVVRHAHEAFVREWCSCAEGMRARVSSTLFLRAAGAKLTIKAGAGPK